MRTKIVGKISSALSAGLEWASVVALSLITLLTVCDVIGRIFRHPILGSYEIVSLAGGLVVGFAIPATSKNNGHVIVDFALNACPKRIRLILRCTTRIVGIIFFVFVGCSLIRLAMDTTVSGEITQVLHLSYSPIEYAMGGAFLAEALVLFSDLLKGLEANHV
jgi:TRAP-type C4-dicarboxylate transport system permease small subunit